MVSLSHLAGPHVTNSYVTYIFLLYYIPLPPPSLLPARVPSVATASPSPPSSSQPADTTRVSRQSRPTFPRSSKHRRKAESVSQFAQICVRVRLCVWSSPLWWDLKGIKMTNRSVKISYLRAVQLLSLILLSINNVSILTLPYLTVSL